MFRRQNSFSPFWVGEFAANDDAVSHGSEYLKRVHQLALSVGMVELPDDINQRIRICAWIGGHIDALNADLQTCLDACHACFYPAERRPIQVLAAPLAQRFGIDGLCNISVEPIVILIDVGRVTRQNWLSIVVHEYAHAHLRAPGHDQRFLSVLSRLCLGLGLAVPLCDLETPLGQLEAQLRHWPHCDATPDPLAFWMGAA